MPFVKLVTNLPDERLPEDFHLALSAKIAKELNKPEEHVSVTVECDRRMSRSGSLDPLCELHCASVGLNTRDLTQPLAKAMTDFLHEHTGIPTTRILFQFFDPMPHMVGLDGHVC
ncbi:MIF-like protein mif-2 [Eriocheir sinensis]|uniref:MIF-like protein mif-2 n=1 Tax=Eriocheir sinensis TaxID=95602 RepID=UPI0021C6511D|nr:MIF-like protein mif-2 [Eriocheir sinensis]XP_050696618.1 MIF-like protein mif-2 [Eriocheir sinensis]XP_050696619.1 MIF-like protein mif-2 [Eriocheir sinensis]XP_050696621.1 MIF-like protein mif-2 [Eriocheir sinensis]XP_050696622.1 MIF-like protein mif-2 [Eriocheir sinensis]XP_050696623.1 MIF-like protein mif-2 [Eriocheir sinensis]XP_050696624.1 MIF-like protein mif-2 [Eriocheir sinensis]